MKDLNVTIIQTDIVWEDVAANLGRYEKEYLEKIVTSSTDLVVFPELFATGFSMQTELLAESMNGKIISWMISWAIKLDCQMCGSIIIKENDAYFNRFVIVNSGIVNQYDKTHLFRMGGENKHFQKGNKRVIHELKGWKILLQVCYDLRFPVFSRNRVVNNEKEYDAMIYVANWPEVRSEIWSTLLRARAIENQVYCIGVNRVGLDGNGINHSGDSAMIDPWGNVVETSKNSVELVTNYELLVDKKTSIDANFPAFLDADGFTTTDK